MSKSTTNPSPAPEQFVRLRKAAEALGVSLRTLYRIVSDGDLRIVKVRSCSCIAGEQLRAYMKQRVTAPQT